MTRQSFPPLTEDQADFASGGGAPSHGARTPRTGALVWMVLWIAFGVFLLSAAGAAFVAHRWVTTSMEGRPVDLMVINGTVSLYSARLQQWVSVVADARLREGDRIRTDPNSQAFVTLFDHSTVRVFPGSELEVVTSASGRFSPAQWRIDLQLNQGTAHLGVAPAFEWERAFTIRLGQARALLEEGGYTLTAEGGKSGLRVGDVGGASVIASGAEFHVRSGQRMDFDKRGATGPIAEREELIRNGDFGHGIEGWQPGSTAGFREGQDLPGSLSLSVEDGRVQARFHRAGSRGTFYETYLFQEVGRDVGHYAELVLSLDFRLVNQSLSGGGYLGTEYPLLVRVNYRTALGDGTALYGFYYQNDANNWTDQAIGVEQNAWIHYSAPVNLMALNPRPQRILSIQAGASGWDYESVVTNISLAAQ
ncbi:MAG: hypothetical protein EXR51_05860 [Dehalococcoidia bacterium]|nr:hypothetical protein [Dehalococcoidia bacterium]